MQLLGFGQIVTQLMVCGLRVVMDLEKEALGGRDIIGKWPGFVGFNMA